MSSNDNSSGDTQVASRQAPRESIDYTRSVIEKEHANAIPAPEASNVNGNAGQIKGEKETSGGDGAQEQPKDFSHDFWDPKLAGLRNSYFKAVTMGTLLVILAIWGCLSIYWGALWKTNYLVYNLEGWIVDYDGGQLGQTVAQAFQQVNGMNTQLSWRFFNASNVPDGRQMGYGLEDALVQNDAWAVVAIRPGASTDLVNAINTANAQYNGSLAVTVYLNQARNENAFTMVMEAVTMPLTMAATMYAQQLAPQIAGRPNVAQLLSQAPQVVTQPLYYNINDVRPYDVPVATAITFVGLIYLLILAFLFTSLNFGARAPLARKLKLGPLLAVRYAAPFIAYFFISWMYALLSLAFKAPFDREFGRVGFVVYWALCYAAMLALGLAMEAVVTLLTPKFTPFFLILWIITNVAVTYVAIELQPSIFRYGYAMPFYNVSQAVRCILFRTKNQLGLNFGVQFAWAGVSLITIPIFQWIARRQEINENAKQEKQREKA